MVIHCFLIWFSIQFNDGTHDPSQFSVKTIMWVIRSWSCDDLIMDLVYVIVPLATACYINCWWIMRIDQWLSMLCELVRFHYFVYNFI